MFRRSFRRTTVLPRYCSGGLRTRRKNAAGWEKYKECYLDHKELTRGEKEPDADTTDETASKRSMHLQILFSIMFQNLGQPRSFAFALEMSYL